MLNIAICDDDDLIAHQIESVYIILVTRKM